MTAMSACVNQGMLFFMYRMFELQGITEVISEACHVSTRVSEVCDGEVRVFSFLSPEPCNFQMKIRRKRL